MKYPTPFDDVIDSRDVIEAIEQDDVTWHAEMVKLHEECKDYVEDWEYGATLIRETYFEKYAEELAEDIGAIPHDVQWPCNCIDWEEAAEELKVDYVEVLFDDVTYLVR